MTLGPGVGRSPVLVLNRIPAITDSPVERQPGPSRRVCLLIGGARNADLPCGGSMVRTGGDACSTREPVRRLHEKLIGSVSSTVVFVFDDMQGGERELPRNTPDHAER